MKLSSVLTKSFLSLNPVKHRTTPCMAKLKSGLVFTGKLLFFSASCRNAVGPRSGCLALYSALNTSPSKSLTTNTVVQKVSFTYSSPVSDVTIGTPNDSAAALMRPSLPVAPTRHIRLSNRGNVVAVENNST